MELSNWKDYKIIDLFELQLSSGDNQENKLLDGDIPLVTSGKFNNGVCKYVDKGDGISELFSGNQITVDMFGQAFYQPNAFYAVSHGRINILKPLFELNENRGLFIATVLTKKLSSKYAMVDMCSQKALQSETIKLPSKEKTKEIDFEYIEEFIKNEKIKNANQFSLFVKVKDCDNTKIDISNWKEFEVGDVFPNIVKPIVYHSHEVIEDDNGIPYVVRSKFNNGIKCYVKRPSKVNPSNVISFGAENSNFFYQETEWVSGRDIYYIDVSSLTKNQALFIASCLQRLSSKYNYSYGLFPELLKKEKIKLPINASGMIDFTYMESYIKNVSFKMSNVMNIISSGGLS